jgi:hypothetical protein
MKYLALILICFTFTASARRDGVIRIQIGEDYNSYSNTELKQRIWRLERAVYQLQQKVYQLEDRDQVSAAEWVCTISALGATYTGLGGSKAVAKVNAIKNCKKAKGENSIFCDDPKCEK